MHHNCIVAVVSDLRSLRLPAGSGHTHAADLLNAKMPFQFANPKRSLTVVTMSTNSALVMGYTATFTTI